jgi:hypothetical protein
MSDILLSKLQDALQDKALNPRTGRYDGVVFDSAMGRNYGAPAARVLLESNGTLYYTDEDEDLYNNIYEKAAGEFYSVAGRSKEKIESATMHGHEMRSGFQTLARYLEDRGMALYRIQGAGNNVRTITIFPDLEVLTKVDGQSIRLPASEAYLLRQQKVAEGSVTRLMTTASMLPNVSASNVRNIVHQIADTALATATRRQLALDLIQK